MNVAAQASLRTDIVTLQATDLAMKSRLDATDRRIDRLVTIMDIEATLSVEPPTSIEYREAVLRLRAMRRFVQN
jgi:hypothetical protein